MNAKLWSTIPDCQLCLSHIKYHRHGVRKRGRAYRAHAAGLLQASEVQSPSYATHEVETDAVHFLQVTRGHQEL